MSSTSYHYTKVVAADLLEFQITTSLGISVKLDASAGHGIIATPTDVTIWFLATLSSSEESVLTAIINAHVALPLQYQGRPVDTDGAEIQRPKAAKAGWANQLHAISFRTSALGKLYNSGLNPLTRVETDLGFATVHFYASDKVTELTAQQDMASVCWTVIDWQVSHDMEIIAGTFYQVVQPTTDILMWTHLAPGPAQYGYPNYPFLQGGINLRMVGGSASGSGPVDNDGRVAKFLSASVPAPGLNKFRSTFKHNAGVQHDGMFLFKLFKSVM